MKRHSIVIATLVAGAALAALASVALATPPTGLVSQLLGRGAAQDELKVAVPTEVTVTQVKRIRVKGKWRTRRVKVTKTVDRALVNCRSSSPCDVAAVRATLAPGGSTGWHSHPLPSLVIVKTGSLTMREAKGGQCSSRTFSAGQAFIHPAGPHNFANASAEQLEFLVTYFAPPAAGLLIDAATPAECP